MKKKKSVIYAFFCVCVLIIAGTVSLFIGISAPDSTDAAKEYVINIAPGYTVKKTAKELKENGIIRSERLFYYIARFGEFRLPAGRYRVTSGMNVFALISWLQSANQVPIKVVLPEGFTINQIARALEKAEVVSADEFRLACSDAELLASYNIPALTLEGYLYPDTYFFSPGMSGKAVAQILVDNFFERVRIIPGFETLDAKQLHNTLILASVVEREYRDQSEAPLMASVFTNRLKYNIGLESCATVVYILTEIEGKPHPDIVTYDDLKINSPYNTYKWAGLPPGPIANPGYTALSAAVNPPKTDYFYFRLVDAERGMHRFSKTLEEHSGVRTLSFKKTAGS